MYMPKDTGGDFTPAPAGSHVAVCIQVVDLGTQHIDFQGKSKDVRQLLLVWELPDEKMGDGRPFTMRRRYTFSSNSKAALRLHLEAWRGQAFKESELSGEPGGFDIKNILGKPCMMSIVHEAKDGKTYANIASIGKMPKNMVAPKAENGQIYFSLDKFDRHSFEALSDHWRDVISKSKEYQMVMANGSARPAQAGEPTDLDDDLNDSIPF